MISRSLRSAAAAGAMAIAAAAFSAPASALTITADNFNRADSNTVGGGWTESSDNTNDAAILANQLRLRDNQVGTPDAAVRQSGFSTIGLTNITVTLDWFALANNEVTDTLSVAWAIGNPGTFNPGSWTTVGTVGGLSSLGQSFALGVAAAGQAVISIMLYTNVSADNTGNNEGFLIDNFVLSGDPVVTPISLPGSGMLLLSGLVGFAAMGGRARKAA